MTAQVGIDPTLSQHVPEPARSEPNGYPGARSVDADLRLVIEQDASSGLYIYKTVNRRTGDVVSQVPRDEILQMRDGDSYAAGQVFRTKA